MTTILTWTVFDSLRCPSCGVEDLESYLRAAVEDRKARIERTGANVSLSWMCFNDLVDPIGFQPAAGLPPGCSVAADAHVFNGVKE